MSSRFDRVIKESAKIFEVQLDEQEAVADETTVDATPAEQPIEAPVEQPAEPTGDPDTEALSVNLVELARKALFVSPTSIDQVAIGKLSQITTLDNAEEISTLLHDIVNIESDVEAEPVIDYNKSV